MQNLRCISRVSLSLASGASAAGVVGPESDIPFKDMATGPGITLSEEEIPTSALGTFYVFDKENAGTARSGEQVARGPAGAAEAGGGCRGWRRRERLRRRWRLRRRLRRRWLRRLWTLGRLWLHACPEALAVSAKRGQALALAPLRRGFSLKAAQSAARPGRCCRGEPAGSPGTVL